MNIVFNSFKADVMSGAIDLERDAIKVMLVGEDYIPDAALHSRRSHITNEVPDSGTYVGGGERLRNNLVIKNDLDGNAVFDADDVSWEGTITARGAVLYKSRGGNPEEDELIGYLDFGLSLASTDGTFTIPWDMAGILNLG